jgi:ATP-dependent Clp protease ATP-binding subunit ClpB
LKKLSQRLTDQDYVIDFDKKLINWITEQAYDPIYGARPIKRFIQHNIENTLANEIIANNLQKNKKYELSYDNKTKKINIYPYGS